MKDTKQKLSPLSIALHWLVAIGMIGMIFYGQYIEDLPAGPDKWQGIGLHKSIAMILLVLIVARVLWRLINKLPKPLSADAPKWQERAAVGAHLLLLLGTLLMPISGLMMSIGGGHSVAVFGWEVIAGSEDKIKWLGSLGHEIHEWGGQILLALIALHVLAALKHALIDRDGTLARMLGRRVES